MSSNGRINKFVVCTAVIILLITAVTFFIKLENNRSPRLTLYDGESGEIYAEFEVYEGMEFSVEFIHSVNKSPVIDVFVIKDGKIIADRTIYSAFGAGVQTELEEGQTLSYDDEKRMVVSGFDTVFPQVKYIVGTVYDHILTIEDERISLTELCGRNSHVVFEIR